MIQKLIGDLLVRLFGLIARLGIHRMPVFEQAFLALYAGYKKYLEAGPIERLKDFVPDGSLVIDVGANVGFFSCRFAKWVGNMGEVISIEPEDRNYDSLISALKREGLLNRVHTLKAVAAAAPGMMRLEINPRHPADHKLSRDDSGLPVTAVTLDDLVPEKLRLRPALVKVDVQGAEMMVLLGAVDILKMAKPALYVELHEEGLSRFGTSVEAILNYLSGHGYDAYWLMKSGPHRRASPADIHAAIAKIGYVDVLFLRA